jgi:hypothetical protein
MKDSRGGPDIQDNVAGHKESVSKLLCEWCGLDANPKCDNGICATHVRQAYTSEGFVYCFLPNPKPKKGKVDYFFICKEPSGFGVKRQKDALEKVKSGALNFCPGKGAKGLTVFYLSIMKCLKGQPYVTDLSKCGMSVSIAREETPDNTKERYENCYPILQAEIQEYAHPKTIFVNVGYRTDLGTVNRFAPDAPQVPHYSISPRLLYPKKILDLMGVDFADIVNEIERGLEGLAEWYLGYFILSNQLEKNLAGNLKGFHITHADALLYLLYKQSFSAVPFK